MGAFWAVLDLVTFFAVLVPICLFSHSEKGKTLGEHPKNKRVMQISDHRSKSLKPLMQIST